MGGWPPSRYLSCGQHDVVLVAARVFAAQRKRGGAIVGCNFGKSAEGIRVQIRVIHRYALDDGDGIQLLVGGNQSEAAKPHGEAKGRHLTAARG